VVADSGPLIHLAQLGKIRLLRTIFEDVLIVPAVKREVVDEGIRQGFPDASLVTDALAEGYIAVRKITGSASSRASKLSMEEKISKPDAESLCLARTSKIPILTDERGLSKLAKMYGLEVWDTWTILLEALRLGLIEKGEIDQAIHELSLKRHKVSLSRAKGILDAAERITTSRTIRL